MGEPNTIFPCSDGKAWWETGLSERLERPRGVTGVPLHTVIVGRRIKSISNQRSTSKTGHQARRESS